MQLKIIYWNNKRIDCKKILFQLKKNLRSWAEVLKAKMFKYDIRLDLFHVDCIQTFAAFDYVERNIVSFVNLIN